MKTIIQIKKIVNDNNQNNKLQIIKQLFNINYVKYQQREKFKNNKLLQIK